MLCVVAAVLHLGDVAFVTAQGDGHDRESDYAAIEDDAPLRRCGRLLGCADLGGLLLTRTMRVPGAVYAIQLTPTQARAHRTRQPNIYTRTSQTSPTLALVSPTH